jgi:hypothetical protein
LGFKERFEALEDIEELLSVAAPQYRDPKVYFDKLIANEKDKNIAEKRLRVLEDLRVRNEDEKREKALERLVRERDQLLKETDWTQLPDVPIEASEKKFYRKYREYLRKLPNNLRGGNSSLRLMEYPEWKKWVESVRHTPGFEQFIP